MGEQTSIEWTDHTFNPWIGCARVSPACRHCYAETFDKRMLHEPVIHWGTDAPRRVTSDANWRLPLRWNRAAARDGVRHRVFCASMADVFEDRDDLVEPRARLFDLIEQTPHLDWLLLTKRPENIPSMFLRVRCSGCGQIHRDHCPTCPGVVELTHEPLPNVWRGTTVEDQTRANERIPHLLNVPAAVRFLSVEPMLGPVDLSPWLDRIGWVICGGESGTEARPMHPDWARALRDQCVDAGVPLLFKQWGELVTEDQSPQDITLPSTSRVINGTTFYSVGKKAAGRELDGRTWDEFPAAAS